MFKIKGKTAMTYLLIYLLIVSVILPYSLLLVSVNRTDDGDEFYNKNNDNVTLVHQLNLLKIQHTNLKA
jgi:cell division protein FtsX